MNQKQMVNAYVTLVKFSGTKMPVQNAYKLYMLRKKIEPSYQFYAEQEQKIIEKYNGTVRERSVSFVTAEDAKHASEEINELNIMEADIEFEPVTIDMEGIKDMNITMEDVANLEGFAVFM